MGNQALHRLSVADAWIAAAALLGRAKLVHQDPEFEAITELDQIGWPDYPPELSESRRRPPKRSKSRSKLTKRQPLLMAKAAR